MSGICGICGEKVGARPTESDFRSMLKALRMPGQENEHAIISDNIMLGAVGANYTMSAVLRSTDNPNLIMAFHGSIYGRNGGLSSLNDGEILRRLLASYLREGEAFVKNITGDFVIAIWDIAKRRLQLFTDRFRVHPLFYYHHADTLIFASRMQGIVAGVGMSKLDISADSIIDCAGDSIIATPKTIFRQVRKLPPGHTMSFCEGAIRVSPYWNFDFNTPARASKAELQVQVKKHLGEAVKDRFDADSEAAVGTYLSGGIDSSTVTGLLTKNAGKSVRTFSIGFGEERFNEIEYARLAAKTFKADAHEYFVQPQDVVDAMPVLGAAFDEPFGNASAVPCYLCAKVARANGTEILYAGDGGDELFAGNERYATQRLFDYYFSIPAFLRSGLVEPAVFGLGKLTKSVYVSKAGKYIKRANLGYPDRLYSYGIFTIVPMSELFDEAFLSDGIKSYNPHEATQRYYHEAPARSELDRQLYIDLKITISDNDLIKVVRTAEWAGITARFPFLDHRVAEFAATVPAKIKMEGRRLRSFFKDAYSDLLPEAIRAKKKHGFGLPIPVWLRTDRQLNEMMHELLLSPRSLRRGYFRRATLERIIKLHQTDQTSFYGTLIWNLMMIELWHRSVEG
jgi:asparagine synthase (glutamine-hydrolysing)